MIVYCEERAHSCGSMMNERVVITDESTSLLVSDMVQDARKACRALPHSAAAAAWCASITAGLGGHKNIGTNCP